MQNDQTSATDRLMVEASIHLVTIDGAAILLGKSLRTIRYWQAQGKMPKRVKVDSKMMYRLVDIADFQNGGVK